MAAATDVPVLTAGSLFVSCRKISTSAAAAISHRAIAKFTLGSTQCETEAESLPTVCCHTDRRQQSCLRNVMHKFHLLADQSATDLNQGPQKTVESSGASKKSCKSKDCHREQVEQIGRLQNMVHWLQTWAIVRRSIRINILRVPPFSI